MQKHRSATVNEVRRSRRLVRRAYWIYSRMKEAVKDSRYFRTVPACAFCLWPTFTRNWPAVQALQETFGPGGLPRRPGSITPWSRRPASTGCDAVRIVVRGIRSRCGSECRRAGKSGFKFLRASPAHSRANDWPGELAIWPAYPDFLRDAGRNPLSLVHATPRDAMDDMLSPMSRSGSGGCKISSGRNLRGSHPIPYALEVGNKLVINPGSLGQRAMATRVGLRDRRHRRVELKRVEYPIEETCASCRRLRCGRVRICSRRSIAQGEVPATPTAADLTSHHSSPEELQLAFDADQRPKRVCRAGRAARPTSSIHCCSPKCWTKSSPRVARSSSRNSRSASGRTTRALPGLKCVHPRVRCAGNPRQHSRPWGHDGSPDRLHGRAGGPG